MMNHPQHDAFPGACDSPVRPSGQREPGIADLRAAAERIRGRATRTPLTHEPGLGSRLGCDLWLKWENRQPTGAFKLRGASNAVARLDAAGDQRPVATHSSGNHGAALACAAQRGGREAWVVMPSNAVGPKVEAVRRFGATVVPCEPTQGAREAGLAELVARGMVAVPPYDHPDIIAGQGTAALEMLEDEPALDLLLAPVGGGGLLAGTAIAARALKPGTTVLGAEPAGAADAHASLQAGARVTQWRPDTIADGLRALVGALTFPILREGVEDILLADDEAIVRAMRLVFEVTGEAIEPSSAVAIAVMEAHPEHFAGRRVGVIVTGGNLDRAAYPWLDPQP